MAEAETRYYTWEDGSRRYRNATSGRFVSRAAVRASLDTVLDVQAERVRGLSADLVAGNATLAEWRSEMSTAIKIGHLEGASVAKGGWLALTTDDYRWITTRVRSELTYLQAFHDDLAYGRTPLDGTVASRAAQYIAAGRSTSRAMEGRMAADRGEELERNIGGDGANSCDECIDCSEQGWVPLGSLPDVGDRTCGPNCHCWLDYRTGRADD